MKLKWRHREAPQLEAVPIDPRQRRVLASLPAWRTEKDHQRYAREAVKQGAIRDADQWPRAYTLGELTDVLLADRWAELVTREDEGPTIIEHLRTLASMGLVTQTQPPGQWSMTQLGLYSLTHEPPGTPPMSIEPQTVEAFNGRTV